MRRSGTPGEQPTQCLCQASGTWLEINHPCMRNADPSVPTQSCQIEDKEEPGSLSRGWLRSQASDSEGIFMEPKTLTGTGSLGPQ